MSLTSCIKRAGRALPAADKAAILAKARDYRRGGMATNDAAVKAVQDQLAEVSAKLKAIEPKPTPKPMTWEMRDTGTLAIQGDTTAIIDKLNAGGVSKTMVMQGGIMVGKSQAAAAAALLRKKS